MMNASLPNSDNCTEVACDSCEIPCDQCMNVTTGGLVDVECTVYTSMHTNTHTHVHAQGELYVTFLPSAVIDYERCGSYYCLNGGNCVNDTCECLPDTQGTYCEYVNGT